MLSSEYSANNYNDRIIILGAGLSGLALAQGLKHHKPPIPFTVFERDELQPQPEQAAPNDQTEGIRPSQPNPSLRSQGYRIRISPSGASALKRLLPSPLWDAFEAMSAAVEEGMAKVDALSGEQGELFGGGGKRISARPTMGVEEEFEDLVGGRSFNADRAVVRSLLLSGLEEGKEIVFGKKAESYSVMPVTEGGGVEVLFADGSVERGSFLVGADGVRSIVRRQMLPEFRLLDTEGRAVFGKTPISLELRNQMPRSLFQGIAVCKDNDEARMMLFCDVMRFDYAAAANHREQVGVDVPKDYIYWVLGFRKDVLQDPESERTLLRLSHEQSADLALHLSQTWHDNIRLLLQRQTRDASSTLAILTSAPGFEQAWAKKPSDAAALVTVMGDSAHPMPPVGGVGANTAWRDAYDLFSALVTMHGEADHSRRAAAVQAYESNMLARAKPLVQRSAGGAMHLMGIKPVDELKEVEWSQ